MQQTTHLIIFYAYYYAIPFGGLVGNFFLLILLLCRRTKQTRKMPVECIYIATKTTYDSLYLLAQLGEFYGVRRVNFVICALEDGLSIFARYGDAMAITAMMFERFIGVMCPDEYKMCSSIRWRSLFAALSPLPIFACQFVFSMDLISPEELPSGKWTSLVSNMGSAAAIETKCVRMQSSYLWVSKYVYYMLCFFIPTILWFLFNSLILFKTIHSSEQKSSSKNDVNASKKVASVENSSNEPQNNSSSKRQCSTSSSSTESSPNGCLPICCCFSPSSLFPLSFVLLNAPSFALLFVYPPVYNSAATDPVGLILVQSANIIGFAYFALNLPIFLLSSKFV